MDNDLRLWRMFSNRWHRYSFPATAKGVIGWDAATVPTVWTLSQVAFTGEYSHLLNKPKLGTAASASSGDFATAAQGTLAASAVQPAALSSAISALNLGSISTHATSEFTTPAQVAASISSAVQAIVGMSPADLDTLAEIAARIQGDESTVAALSAVVSLKEPKITAGLASQFWRGDKQWQTFAVVAVTGAYADLSGKPALFSGAYADLTGKPTIPAAQIQADWTQASSGALDFIKNKPTLVQVSSLTPSPLGTAAAGASADAARADHVHAKPSGLLTLVGTYTIAENILISANISMKRVAVAVSGVTTADKVLVILTGAPTAGCEILNAYVSAANTVSVGVLFPAVGILTAYSIPIALYKVG